MENANDKKLSKFGATKKKLGQMVQMGTMAAALTIGGAANINCNGGSGGQAVTPEPKLKPYLTVVQKQNATASHQSGYREEGETLTVHWTANEGYTLDCPGHTVTMNGNQTVSCAHTVEKIPEINTDTYDTEFALRDALMEIAEEIFDREILESQWKHYGDRIKVAYVEAFARDSYAQCRLIAR